MTTAPKPCRGPRRISRRSMIEIGGCAALGLGLPQVLREAVGNAEAGAGLTPTADACILVFLDGGPSHLDMWDMKPDAPAEIRGEFQPIATRLPGITVSEHLPRFSRVLHHGTLIRSAHHSVNNSHGAAVYTALTGLDRGEVGGIFQPTDHPAIGSVVGLCRPPRPGVIPFVSMPYITTEGRGAPPQPGFFGGWLGRSHDPLFVLKDPNADDFAMPELTLPAGVDLRRLQLRQRLEGALGGLPPGLGRDRRLGDLERFQERAFDLLTSSAAQAAFRIDREDPRTRDRYGRNIYGQSVLLARRLVEAGTRVVCISWAPDANATWDTHGNNFPALKNTLLPQLDAALSSLVDDLVARGMLGRTLVVAMGEFGRSPKVNAMAGRDHWNFGYSLWLAGGGVKAGHVLGASDKIGARPQSDPVTPAEIVATIYRCLGIPADRALYDQFQRPLTVVPNGGRPIEAILA